MRKRLSQEQRRSEILKHAGVLFRKNGFAKTEMEDIRLACGISRGGLYHYFGNKNAILAAIIECETEALLRDLEGLGSNPIEALLRAGSGHLGNEAGIVTVLGSDEEKLTYLAYLETAQYRIIRPVLQDAMEDAVRRGIDTAHVVELFLTVNSLINRRVIMGEWTMAYGAGFAATALDALAPLMSDEDAIRRLAEAIREGEQDQ